MHAETFLHETARIASLLDAHRIEAMVRELHALRERKGRLFVIGLGGSAANASHAVNDFRKLCSIEAYAPADNVSELTARANDEGWGTIFSGWMTFVTINDALMVLSVGGGSEKVSLPLIEAVNQAKSIGMKILAIVGRDGGYTAKYADCCLIVPTLEPSRVTPHTESFQSIILHALVSHPDLQRKLTRW